jgi:LysM repeat protein
VERSRVTRWVAPFVFLAVITIGALVVRAGLEHGAKHAGTSTTTATFTQKRHGHGRPRQRLRTYMVEQGDTLESIATKERTTVARLERLNPGINPTALRVGERIRVQ